MFNISEILHSAIPDAEGNIIPTGTYEGSAELSGSQGEVQHILVTMDASTYNVVKATCGAYCKTCQGAADAWVYQDPFVLPFNATHQLTFTVQNHSGTQVDDTSAAGWSSSDTNVATVNGGLVTSVAVGTLNANVFDDSFPLYSTGCYAYAVECPVATGIGSSAPGNVVTAAISQNTSGQAATDDSARGNYEAVTGTYNMGPFTNATPYGGCGIGYETVGTVSPASYTGNVVIHRTIATDQAWINSTENTAGEKPPNSDDTDSSILQDENPQSGGSAGKVYDVDAPGTNPAANGTIYRLRVNFYTFAALPDGTTISPPYSFYVRVSCQWLGPGYTFVNDVPGDNQIGVGTTKTTWNLQ